ncbi:MAG TPA: FUSC family protein [Myxococcota bacterium]|nr:FUSC family protein [Myxococcota bacterium]
MTSSSSAAIGAPSRLEGASVSLIAFLRRELAPFPGRATATLRIVLACVVVLVLCMTLRVPEAYLSVWFVFKVALEESGETLLIGIVALAAITVAIAVSLVLLFVAMDQPALRFCLIGVTAAAAFFLRRVFVIGPAGFVLGLVPTVVLTLPDFMPTAERAVRLTLWLWPVFGLGIAAAVAANLWIAPSDPASLLREELVRRVRAAEDAIAARLGARPDAPAVAPLATSGITKLLGLLRSTELVHPSLRTRHAQQSALITLVDRLLTAAAALNESDIAPRAGERARLAAVANACARLRLALENGEPPSAPASGGSEIRPPEHGSALLPILVELEHVVALLQQVQGSDARSLAAAASEPERPGVFVEDAFTNAEYMRYALKGALAVLLCDLIMNALDWPGIRTCYITCMIVGLTSEGATIQKGTLRIAGALVGGAMGFLAILLLVSHMVSITSLALLVAAGSAVAAWVYVGSARISYAGVQIALAFFICVIQSFEPSWWFYTIRDRMVGIVLGNTLITLVFLGVWPVRAGTAMWIGFGSALRAMADLARVGGRSDDQAVVAREIQRLRLRAYRHFAAAQQSAEEEEFEWNPGARAGAERDRFLAATADAQAVFLTQLTIASQRPSVAPADLPGGVVAAIRRFDERVGTSLDLIAGGTATSLLDEGPDLQGALAKLSGAVSAELSRSPERTWTTQVEGRLALYRELVPRLQRLESTVLG